MALCPFARHELLPENATQARISPTQVILHSAVDAPGESDLYGFFKRADVLVESTFFVQNDGDVIQYMDTTVRADANRYANVRAVSIETEDDGNPDQRPWTEAQLASLKRLLAWLFQTHPAIQRRVCPSWDQPGVGYHTMWGSPSEWTPVEGKTCPGRVRVTQFNNVIVPWLHGTSTPEDDELALTTETKNWLRQLVFDRQVAINAHTDQVVADLESRIDNIVEDTLVRVLSTRGHEVRRRIRELAQMGANDAEADNEPA